MKKNVKEVQINLNTNSLGSMSNAMQLETTIYLKDSFSHGWKLLKFIKEYEIAMLSFKDPEEI